MRPHIVCIYIYVRVCFYSYLQLELPIQYFLNLFNKNKEKKIRKSQLSFNEYTGFFTDD